MNKYWIIYFFANSQVLLIAGAWMKVSHSSVANTMLIAGLVHFAIAGYGFYLRHKAKVALNN